MIDLSPKLVCAVPDLSLDTFTDFIREAKIARNSGRHVFGELRQHDAGIMFRHKGFLYQTDFYGEPIWMGEEWVFYNCVPIWRLHLRIDHDFSIPDKLPQEFDAKQRDFFDLVNRWSTGSNIPVRGPINRKVVSVTPIGDFCYYNEVKGTGKKPATTEMFIGSETYSFRPAHDSGNGFIFSQEHYFGGIIEPRIR